MREFGVLANQNIFSIGAVMSGGKQYCVCKCSVNANSLFNLSFLGILISALMLLDPG